MNNKVEKTILENEKDFLNENTSYFAKPYQVNSFTHDFSDLHLILKTY